MVNVSTVTFVTIINRKKKELLYIVITRTTTYIQYITTKQKRGAE